MTILTSEQTAATEIAEVAAAEHVNGLASGEYDLGWLRGVHDAMAYVAGSEYSQEMANLIDRVQRARHLMNQCHRSEHDTFTALVQCSEEPCGAGADPFGRTAEDWKHHVE